MSRKIYKKNLKNEKGVVIIFVTIAIPLLMAFVCLSVDVCNLFLTRMRMQIAADATALAVGVTLNTVAPGNTAKATTAGQSIATLNGFTNGTNKIAVTISIPPGDPYKKSPTYATNSNYGRVQITQPVPLYFGKMVGISTVTVSTNAVAGPTTSSVSLMTLAPSGSGSLSITGTGSISATNGTIAVSSTDSAAMKLVGVGSFTANTVNIAGGYSIVGGGGVNGTINAHSSNIGPNPFASLALPTAPYTCNHTNFSVTGGSSTTVSPGVYCGGISITGVATTTFNPGTYILYGGGLSIVGGSSVSGNGVTFYNTGTASGADAYGSFSFVGVSTINFSAPTTGAYAGMLFIQDPLNTKSLSLTGGSSDKYAGNIYLPGASLTITGADAMSQPLGITVVQNISITGGSSISFSTQYGGSSGQISLFE